MATNPGFLRLPYNATGLGSSRVGPRRPYILEHVHLPTLLSKLIVILVWDFGGNQNVLSGFHKCPYACAELGAWE